MHPLDVMDALDGMILLIDTREQDTALFRSRLRAFPRHEREKLDFGDYSAKFPLPEKEGGGFFTLSGRVSVERKMSIDELCQCFTHDRDRFEREFERAKAAGGRVYLLIEGANFEAIYAGKYRSKMRETALIASLLAFLARYDCRLIFCKPETTGRLIKDILYREGKERLEHLGDSDYGGHKTKTETD